MKVAIIQCSMSTSFDENMAKVENYLTKAKHLQAELAVVPELFLSHYFCKTQEDRHFSMAMPIENNPYLSHLQKIAKRLELVIPFSFFEKDGPEHYNSVVMIDNDGTLLGVYRKSHLPDGPGYQEKFYFKPGNTGFMVFNTNIGNIGAGICWDQWFPEAARLMTMYGADILIYPTAIGSEPNNPTLSTLKPWQRVMQGHAVANMIPIAAANRVGVEDGQTFYGGSFIADELGELSVEMGDEEGVRVFDVDINRANAHRNSFGFFRDRREELYEDLC